MEYGRIVETRKPVIVSYPINLDTQIKMHFTLGPLTAILLRDCVFEWACVCLCVYFLNESNHVRSWNWIKLAKVRAGDNEMGVTENKTNHECCVDWYYYLMEVYLGSIIHFLLH